MPGGSPGLGPPALAALGATPDDGVVFDGIYAFGRTIECGSEDEPKKPEIASCSQAVSIGLVGRVDASGKLLWAAKTGEPYHSQEPRFDIGTHGNNSNYQGIAVLSDGSVLAVGSLIVDPVGTINPHVQALAIRYDGNGKLLWIESFPWGPAPGVTFLDGTYFTAVAPQEGGAADISLMANGTARLVRLDAEGKVTRVSAFDSFGSAESIFFPHVLGKDTAYWMQVPGGRSYPSIGKFGP